VLHVQLRLSSVQALYQISQLLYRMSLFWNAVVERTIHVLGITDIDNATTAIGHYDRAVLNTIAFSIDTDNDMNLAVNLTLWVAHVCVLSAVGNYGLVFF
jgi:hypothetical protein